MENESVIEPKLDHRAEAAMAELDKLAELIAKVDPALYVCIEHEESPAVGAEAIGLFYEVSWSPDMNVIQFCQNVRDKIIKRHGISSVITK